MGLDALLSKLRGDTPDTLRNLARVSAKPILYKACTPDTSDTSKNINGEEETGKAGGDTPDTPDTPPIGCSTSWEAKDLATQQPAAPMHAGEEKAIRAWLEHIEETDAEIIAEVVEKCQRGEEARDYFIKRVEEVPKPDPWPPVIRCGVCINFKRIDHSHLGYCAKGEPQAIAGLWDTGRRYCQQYQGVN